MAEQKEQLAEQEQEISMLLEQRKIQNRVDAGGKSYGLSHGDCHTTIEMKVHAGDGDGGSK